MAFVTTLTTKGKQMLASAFTGKPLIFSKVNFGSGSAEVGEIPTLEDIKEAKADAAVLQIKSMEAFEKAADGKATKIIVPSNLASIAGTLTALSETVQKDAPES